MTISIQRPEVGHDALAPEKCMVCLTVWQIGLTHDVSGIVYPDWIAVVST